ncbi:hypothetical protein OCB03_27725 [Bacillus cereus]|nr:hypothetical protein [Bacillus cereus]
MQRIISFYNEEMSNHKWFQKQISWIIFYMIFITSFFLILIINPRGYIWTIILSILTFFIMFILIVSTYKFVNELEIDETLTFSNKMKKCFKIMVTTKLLLSINNSELVRLKKINTLRVFLRKKGLYNEKCLSKYIEVLDKEYQTQFSTTSIFPVIIGLFVPIWTFFIQIVFNPKEFSPESITDFDMVKYAALTLMLYMICYYLFFRSYCLIIKPLFLLVIPIRKYEMLDLLSILRELHLERFVFELEQEEKKVIKGFTNTD